MASRVRKTDISPIVKQLGVVIENEIKNQKRTIRDVAFSSDMDPENLRKYIKGRQEMKVSTLFRIAQGLEIKPSELIARIKE